MFSNRIFRTTEELDFVRGPGLTAYLRFEILLWAAIVLLTLLSVLGETFLPTPVEPTEIDARPALLAVMAFSLGALVVFVAVWRFKKWGVYVLALWTLILAASLVMALFAPALDALFLLALAGFIAARAFILFFEIRPRWSYFQNGLF